MRELQAARGTALSEQPAQDPPADAAVGSRPRRTVLLGALAAVVLALDIATKIAVVAELEGRRTLELLGGQLLIRVSRNPGAAFSFAEGAPVLFTAVAVGVVVVIVRVSRRLYSGGWAISLGLLL
ncbi:MAG: signal peptidase II, partial [Pseudorhodobacter sp.]|nr:signal peptidase II [Frankiaceae bacterium]